MTKNLFHVFANQDSKDKLWAVCAVNLEGQPQLPVHSEHADLKEAIDEVMRVNRIFSRDVVLTFNKQEKNLWP